MWSSTSGHSLFTHGFRSGIGSARWRYCESQNRPKAPKLEFSWLPVGACELQQTRLWLGLVGLSRIPSGVKVGRPSWGTGSRTTRTGRLGRLTTSRHQRRRPPPPPRPPLRRARDDPPISPTTRRQLTPSPQSDRRAIRRRRPPAPLHPFPNPTYTDGSPKQREPVPAAPPRAAFEHTDHDSADVPGHYSRHSGADGQPRPAGDWAHLANVGALARTKTLPLRTVAGPSPHSQTEKKTTSTPDLRRRMTSPHQQFFLPRIFTHDVSRTEREFARARRRPGLPRDQFYGPWLFSTAEARTSNSSSSPETQKRQKPVKPMMGL